MSTRATFVVVWLACLLLLAGNLVLARLDLGALAPAPILAIAALQALLILWFFLHLRRARALVRLAAFAAFFWVLILFGLSLGDYLTRTPGAWPPELAQPRRSLAPAVRRPGPADQRDGRRAPRPRRRSGQASGW